MEVDLQVVLGLKQPRELLSQFHVCLCFVTEEPNTGHGCPDLVLEGKQEFRSKEVRDIGGWGCEESSDLIPTHDACLPALLSTGSYSAVLYQSLLGPRDPTAKWPAEPLGRTVFHRRRDLQKDAVDSPLNWVSLSRWH